MSTVAASDAPTKRRFPALPSWSLVVPGLAALILAGSWGRPLGVLTGVVLTVTLFAAVSAAVHHAEVIAHRVGEPFGTLVLAIAVTIIEVALIVILMLAGGASTSALARDTVFSAVMIVCNGVMGLCLIVGGRRHHVVAFRVDGTSPVLAALGSLAVLALVLPNFTSTVPGPAYSGSQLAFAGVTSFWLYTVYIGVQTVRHREYFLSEGDEDAGAQAAPPPSNAVAWICLGLLLVSLISVIGLAKVLAPSLETAVAAAGLPSGVTGVVIALVVLLPETVAAVRAALANRMQGSINLALGSGLASIGLTIPVVAALSPMLPFRLVLGLPPLQMVMLALTMGVSTLTLGTGRATVLQGAVHMVLFAAFLFLTAVP
jgi:Ca2+:H+ antiporter